MEQTPENIQQSSSVLWHQHLREYGVAFGFSLAVFVVFSFYLFERRGYYDLFIINKAFAGVAAVLLGVVLLLGPASRMFNAFDRYLRYRKEFGILAFFLALAHTVTSLLFLPDKFSLSRYVTAGLWPFLFGLTGILVLLGLFVISNGSAMRRLTPRRWWSFQHWGVRVVFALVAFHIGIMKVPGWIDWYKNGGSSTLVRPEWPGLGIIVAWFLAAVILVRLAEAVNRKLGVVVWYFCAIMVSVIIIGSFLWGRQFVR